MIEQDRERRLFREMMVVALDVRSRMSGIETAAKEKPALFDRGLVRGMKEFGEEGLRQRGGGVSTAPSGGSTQQIADEFLATCARVDTLCAKLRRSRFGRNALILAAISIHNSE